MEGIGMRVLTLNLWGRRGEWAARRQVLIDGLRVLTPDLVAFQETIVNDEYDQVSDLLGPDFYVAHQVAREPGGPGDVEAGQGISLASRWPLGEVRELDLHATSRTSDFACGTLMADVHAPEPFGSLLFVNHFPNWQLAFEHERELQTVKAARVIEDLVGQRTLHVIVAGDLDADPDASSIRFWSGRQSLDGMSVCYRDAWESAQPGKPGHTFTARNPLMSGWDWPFQRIDYIFVRCGLHWGPTLRIRDCSLVFDEPRGGAWASDHFGIMAELEVPGV
jgi:endonuclease/exonuclease/phosphatase family metal-dependent hydrolase